MKCVRRITLITLTTIVICSCASNLKQFEKRDSYFDNSSVLGLNAINADYNYYTKAILEYLLIKKIVDGNSLIYNGTPKKSPDSDSLVTQVALFPKLNQADKDDKVVRELKNRGVKYCFYDLPKTLSDLTSGFQFNHYVFQSSNRAAMQAFGIIDSEVKASSLYIVTDYLQYEDVDCTGLPTIRYAVGMRAQFRISQTQSESELNGIGSLAGLAAQVETNQKTVNITIKTIGITGLDSRLSIPSNTTFDVKTYSEYEKIIDFIRNMKDTSIDDNREIIISPQIIPVMDEYRTTIEHTFHPMYETIELLETKVKVMEKEDNGDSQEITKLKNDISKIKLDLIKAEIEELKSNREILMLGNKIINDYSKYSDLLLILDGLENSSSQNLEELKSRLNLNFNQPISYQKSTSKDINTAKFKENSGFQSLISKNLNEAINFFIEAENAYNGYNQVYEISRYLKTKMGDENKNDQFWIDIYKKILKDFNYNLPPSIKSDLERLSK